MDCDSSGLFIALIISIYLYGFFALVRTALIRSRLSYLNDQMGFGVEKAKQLLTESKYYIPVAHLGTFLSAGVAGILLSLLVIKHAFSCWIIIPAFLVVTLFAMLSSYAQRGLAYNDPNAVLRIISYPYGLLAKILYLPNLVLVLSLKILEKFGFYIPNEKELPISAEEISELVERSSAAGEINQSEKEMIKGVFDFSDTRVKEVMTPRTDIVFLPVESTIQEAKNVFITTMHSRILVIESEVDNVKGVLFAKDLLGFVGEDITSLSIKELIRPVTQVFAGSRVDRVLRDFKKNAIHFAVVSDEHGGIGGIITIEDLLEELVGDIYDEYDDQEDKTEVTETGLDEFTVDGGVLIDDLNQDYDLSIPTGEYDTLAGYVIHGLGCIPEVRDTYLSDNLLIEVLEKEVNRITKLRIKKF